MKCPKYGKPVEEHHMQAGRISRASVTDLSARPTKVVKYTGREIAEFRYYCRNCGGQFSESEVIREETGKLTL